MKLVDAILDQDLYEVQRMLTEKPERIDERGEHGVPLSFFAAWTGNLEILKYIVEYSRASMNEFDDMHRNILHYGVVSGNLRLVKYLVERVGMSPLYADANLVTPFDLAHELANTEEISRDGITLAIKEKRTDRGEKPLYAEIENYIADVV